MNFNGQQINFDRYYDDPPDYADDYDDDEYPHRIQEADTLERTISFSRYGAHISAADTRFAVAPSVLVETMENLRRICDAIPTPPAGYAVCCDCYSFTPNTSGTCQHCGGEYAPF